ncbi:expressed unknown protein [Seminavis robusta]|uniref:Uncharacterized protein n=1 Tax=Seminavis robusta TaxID=568900 RepID=A0A9N8E939_9STRA|nr:expressed unknown protein [Seminavis robusta]|eukprot:Sro644_g180540.1 n/a (169) ;mRNA; f:50346-50852
MTLDAAEFKWPIIATLLHALQYIRSLNRQTKTKYRLTKQFQKENKDKPFDRYNSNHPEMLAADRAFLNFQEQSIPFLTALWLQAVFVNPNKAGKLGVFWVLLRMVYPTLLGKQLENVNPKRVALVTFPCYMILYYMLGDVLRAGLQWQSGFFMFFFMIGFPMLAYNLA